MTMEPRLVDMPTAEARHPNGTTRLAMAAPNP